MVTTLKHKVSPIHFTEPTIRESVKYKKENNLQHRNKPRKGGIHFSQIRSEKINIK